MIGFRIAEFRRRDARPMFDVSVYYCWSCDAHRKAVPASTGEAKCPRCGELLSRDARLASPTRPLLLPTATLAAPREQLATPA